MSLPVFQFLFWRWNWRLLLWWQLIWRISRLDLQLIATQPDLSGGLGGFGVAHVDLAPLGLGFTSTVITTYAENMMVTGAWDNSYVLPIASVVAGVTLTLMAPLAMFIPRLLEIKQRGLLDYGALAADYARAFDMKWIGGKAPADETMLGTADIQSLADLANSFGIIRSMRIVPIAWSQILMIAAAAALPVVLLAVVLWPLDELIVHGVRTILSI